MCSYIPNSMNILSIPRVLDDCDSRRFQPTNMANSMASRRCIKIPSEIPGKTQRKL